MELAVFVAVMIALLVVIGGVIFTIVFLIAYLITRRKTRLRQAAFSFSLVVITFVLTTLGDLVFFPYNYNTKKKEEVLAASREAPIGGIRLHLYADSTYEKGGFRQVTSTGVYKQKTDTLFLTTRENPEKDEHHARTTFLLKKGYLQEIGNAGIGSLEIHLNKLKP